MTYPYIPGSTKHTSGPNSVVTRVVIHGTVSPCSHGQARAVAGYFQQPTSGGLAHYVVDTDEVIQCCKEDVACWHAPPNKGSIGVELCDPQSGPDGRWSDANHERMLRLAAVLVADLCRRHDLPIAHLSPADLLAGKHGIAGHVDVSQAWHQSSHTDPGSGFPWTYFLGLVKAASQPVKATVQPQPVQPVEARMIVRFSSKPDVWEVVGSHLEHVTAAAFKARGLTGGDITVLPDTDGLNSLPKTDGAA